MDSPASGDAAARNEGVDAAASGAATGTAAESAIGAGTATAAGAVTGAGEGFLAALVASLHVELVAPPKALERACALGAYVASCGGAGLDSSPWQRQSCTAYIYTAKGPGLEGRAWALGHAGPRPRHGSVMVAAS